MAWLIVVTRRLLWVALVAIAGGVMLAWWRDRSGAPSGDPPEWPPLEPPPSPAPEPAAAPAPPPVAEPAAATAPRWVEPDEGGACPAGYPVKVKESSGIYHVPGGRFYERTNADRCYLGPDAAEADGYRRSKS